MKFPENYMGPVMNDGFYKKLSDDMKKYRAGMCELPDMYINLHHMCAYMDVPAFSERHNLRIIAREEVSNGWCDGMKVVRLIAEDKLGNLKDFRWSDSNGGSWFERLPSGGQSLVEKSPCGPGHF